MIGICTIIIWANDKFHWTDQVNDADFFDYVILIAKAKVCYQTLRYPKQMQEMLEEWI